MKKRITILFLIICFIMVLALSTPTKVSAASTANIRYITTTVGETETSIGINYHCDVDGSYVIYGVEPSLNSNTSKEKATSVKWGAAKMASDDRTGFADRYVCKVNLTNLEENTTYYYQVHAGDETSEIYSFTTYSATGSRTNILFATDIHASPSMPNTGKTANSMFQSIMNQYRNLNLVVMTGDQIDRGGYEDEWQTMYNNMTTFKSLIQATIPGNHEYYHSNSSSYISPEFYNQFYNNPQNGATERLNSSYYFKYGNILFIMIDTINRQYLQEQQEWFKSVCESVPAEFIIVGTHAGGITAGVYEHDASWMQQNWVPLWEKYQVDLCLSGHEHIYLRKDHAYEGTINEDLGVTYLVGCAAGHKTYAVQDGTGLVVYKTSFACNLITVRNNKIEVSLFDQNGNELNQKFELTSRREGSSEALTDQEIYDAIKLEYNKESDTGSVTWDPSFYGTVKNIIVERVNPAASTFYDVFIATAKVTSRDISPIYAALDYEIKVTAVKYDGTEIKKEFKIYNQASYRLNLELDGGLIDVEMSRYTTGIETQLPTPTKAGYKFVGWYDNPEFTGNKLSSISATQGGNLTLYAKYEEAKATSGSGCQMGAFSLITSLLAVTTLVGLILRKRK